MNNKEAVDLIKVARAEVEWNYPIDYTVAFDLAIDALMKATPKLPKNEKYHIDLEISTGKCPSCNAGVNSEMKYCMECGQRILWMAQEEGDVNVSV